jgi:quercetin dioxygenase-like cupin family protein
MTKSKQPDLPEVVREAAERDPRLGDARVVDALTALAPAPKAPPQLLRERLLSTVARPRLRFAPLFGALSELFDLGDSDLAGIFERAAAPETWAKTPIPGAELLHLIGGPRTAGSDNGLVRLAAGARFPMHRHLGAERVLVLDGAYRDEQSGKLYLPGDSHVMPPGSSHSYVALSDRDLLFAVSVVAGVDVEGIGTLTPSSS